VEKMKKFVQLVSTKWGDVWALTEDGEIYQIKEKSTYNDAFKIEKVNFDGVPNE